MFDLTGKVAVITGGASGIGEFGTRRFAAEGATVIMLDINETAGNNLANELDNVFFIKTDIHFDVDNCTSCFIIIKYY